MLSSDPILIHMHQYRSDSICNLYHSYCLYYFVLCERLATLCILLQQGHMFGCFKEFDAFCDAMILFTP